jgi:hypothetical protein
MYLLTIVNSIRCSPYQIRFTTFFALIFLYNCEQTLLLQPVDAARQLTVLALLENGRELKVRVSATNALAGEIDFRISNGEVWLYQDDTLISYVNEPYQFAGSFDSSDIPLQTSTFLSSDSITLIDGSRYRIEVAAPNFDTLVSNEVEFREVIGEVEIVSITRMETDNALLLGDSIAVTLNRFSDGEIITQRGIKCESFYSRLNFESAIKGIYQLTSNRRVLGRNLPVARYEDNFNHGVLPLDDGCFADTTAPYLISVTHFSEEFLAFAVPFSRQDQTEVTSPYSNNQPLPNNVRNGYGYFMVLDQKVVCR